MAAAVYPETNDLCKNNYYYALLSDNFCNPPTASHLQTGIVNSGASGFCFAPGAPVANYNPTAPKVGVRVANGHPESSVASATLASVPTLPQEALVRHVMPSFPHSLIGLGPFVDQGCSIVFTKTNVTVYDTTQRPILKGWREQTGARLWRFPLKPTKPLESQISPNMSSACG